MSNDGGPASEMNLREFYARGVLEALVASGQPWQAPLVLDYAQKVIDEAVKRRGEDASELQGLRAENAELKAKIAEFIDGERHGEPEPRPGDE